MSRRPVLPRYTALLVVAAVGATALTLLPARAQKSGGQIQVSGNSAPVTININGGDTPVVDVTAGGKGRINYDAGVIKATGYGAMPARANSIAQAKLMALGAAKADALRNLAMTVNDVRVTSSTTVKNYVLESDVIRTEVEALLKAPRIISEKIETDGTAVVVMELPMYGKNSLAAVVLPKVLREESAPAAVAAAPVPGFRVFKGPAEPAVKIAAPRPKPAPAPLPGGEPGLTPESDPGPFTAVLVDCRGLGVEAVMSPKLYDTDGREIYGTVRVSHDYAIEVGIASYPRSMAEAIRSERAGSKPLIVRAVGVADKHRFNPVISRADGDRILAANQRDGFLERTAVVLLVDPVRYKKW
jgi:Uncharacterized protein conserved in bacteria